MIRQLKLMEWWFTVMHFAIPAISFTFAGYVRFASGYFTQVGINYYSYTGLLVVATMIWAFISEHFQLHRLIIQKGEYLATAKATAVTMSTVLVLTFFYRGTSFSRVFILLLCALVLVSSI